MYVYEEASSVVFLHGSCSRWLRTYMHLSIYCSISIIAGPKFLSVAEMMNFLSFFTWRSSSMRSLSRLKIGGIMRYVLKVSVEVVSNSSRAVSMSFGANGGSQSDDVRSFGL